MIVMLLCLSTATTACVNTPPVATEPSKITGTSAATSVTAATTSKEPMEISYIINRDLAANVSVVTKELSEKLKSKGFNVKFVITEMGTYDATEWSQKFNVRMASGEKPADIMLLDHMLPEGIAGGWFAELDMKTVEKAMPKYANEINSKFSELWAYGKDTITGKLYGIPEFNMYGPNRHVFTYREDWLKTLGLNVPTTLQEFEVWLQKVRTGDPNGNGQKDEYGYTAEDKTTGPAFSEIFGAYGIMPGMWSVRDGKVVRGDIQPEAKEALAWIKKWYDADLIPKGVMTTSKDRDEFYANKIGAFGSANCYGPAVAKGGYIDVAMQKIAGAKLLVALPPKGPKGDAYTFEWGPRKYVLTFGKQLEKDTNKLDTIMRMFETIATDKELFEFGQFGAKGVVWDFVDKTANKGAIQYLGKYTDVNIRLKEIGVRDLSESAFCPVWIESVYKDYVDPEALGYATMNKGMYDALLNIVLPSQNKYLDDLVLLSKTAYLDIITGKKPLSSFDDFVIKWKANGGDQLTQEANDLYTKAFKK